jgi:tetratricopeptide (TPR) repeat protein
MAAAAGIALALAFLPPAPRFSPGHMSLILSEVLAARGDSLGSRRALAEAAATGEIYEASHNLANVYFKQQRYAEAAAEYERALRIEPEAVETLYGLANAEREQGHGDAARAALGRALHLAPGDPRIVSALYAQALADARAGRRAQAEEGFDLVLRWRPSDGGALLNLALLAEADGDLEAAAAALRRAEEQGAGDHLEWLLCAGRVAARRGQEAEARARFERARVLAPADPRASAALRALAR